jgi:hypothetical protein
MAHRLTAALLAALAFVVLGAETAAAQEATWSVVTADNDFGADRDNYGYTVDPGGRLDDGLVITNPGPSPLDLAVYAADAFTTDDGRLDLRPRNTTATGVGAWVHPNQEHITVPSGQSVSVPFIVTVPQDAATGDHMGGIVTALTQNGVERRVGLRIRLRVGGTLNPALSLEDLSVDYSGTPNPIGAGDATLSYTIHNTGNAIVTARQAAAVEGPFGTWRVAAGRIDDSPELLPGEKWQVSVPVHGVVPALRLTGTVTLAPLLTDASGSTAPLAGADTAAHGAAVPWVLVAIVVVLGAGAVLSRRRGKRNS